MWTNHVYNFRLSFNVLILGSFGVSSKPARVSQNIMVRWLPPPPGWIKVNPDGAAQRVVEAFFVHVEAMSNDISQCRLVFL